MPPGDVAGTRTGDIILNSNYNFGVGPVSPRDLYTVFLQEAGHALGVGNSPNPASAMYEFYQGRADRTEYRGRWPHPGPLRCPAGTDLGAGRPATILRRPPRPWPGRRPPDLWRRRVGRGPDWYSFTAPTAGAATVRLEVAGLSLLAGRIAVLQLGPHRDRVRGRERCRARTWPSHWNGWKPGATYYVRVDEVAGTAFAAGQYRLRIDTGGDGPSALTLGGQAPVDDAGRTRTSCRPRVWTTSRPTGNAVPVFARLGAGRFGRVQRPLAVPRAEPVERTDRDCPGVRRHRPEITVTNALGLVVVRPRDRGRQRALHGPGR